jgi:hypothetical protein
MTAGRDPIDRLIDVAVAAPICSMIALGRALPIATKVVRARFMRPQPPRPRTRTTPVVSPVVDAAAGTRIRPATPAPHAGGQQALLAIEGYDHLAARQVVDRLGALQPDELAAVAAYERSHRHRQTVLHKIEQLTA